MINKKVFEDYYKIYKSRKCIICKSPIKKCLYFYSTIFYDNFESTADIYNCRKCETGYTYPFLTEAQSNKIYINYGSHTHDEKIGNNIFYKIFKFIEEKVIRICLNSGSVSFNKLITSFVFQRFFQTFPLYTNRKGRKIRILDIGCGGGYFLQLTKKAGCEVYGTEVNKKLVNKLRSIGINAYLNMDTIINQKIKFDIVRINHVVEHLVDPNPVFKKIKRLLHKNSELIMGVPNYNTPAKVFKKNMFMHIPYHRLHLAPRGASYLLENNGYKITYLRTKSCGIFSWSLLRALRLNSNTYTIPVKFLEMISLSLLFDFFKKGDSLEVYAHLK